VIGAKDALAAGDPDRFGEILVTAHRDIAENYEASCPELNFVVDAAVDAGAYGARLTGAGWGGAAVAIVDVGSAEAVARELEARYADQFPARDAETHVVEPSAGVAVERRD
jgi:galactokinase